MARKNGLNRKEQIMCAKWQDEGIAVKDIAKKLKTSTAVVKKFTQKALDKADAAAKARMSNQNKATQKVRKTAAVLKETLEQTAKEDGEFS